MHRFCIARRFVSLIYPFNTKLTIVKHICSTKEIIPKVMRSPIFSFFIILPFFFARHNGFIASDQERRMVFLLWIIKQNIHARWIWTYST